MKDLAQPLAPGQPQQRVIKMVIFLWWNQALCDFSSENNFLSELGSKLNLWAGVIRVFVSDRTAQWQFRRL